MATNYLDRYRSTLPTVQGNQILKRLTAKRDGGEIRTLEEFKAQLKTLTQTLIEERITPTIKLFQAVAGTDISSEQYNEMLERIRDDLEAAFTEADNLDDVIALHQNIVQQVSLKAIRFGIHELQSQISLYEFIARSAHGFSTAVNNTFRESQKLNTSRSDPAASFVFIDPRRVELIPTTEDAQIDAVGERLLLAAETSQTIQPRAAEWLSNENSIRGEVDVSFPNASAQRVVDGRNNTYWVVPVLLSNVKPSGVPLELAIHLNGHQTFNVVEIEPATEYPMALVGIDYLNSANTRTTIFSEEILLTGPTSILLDRVTTDNLIIRVRQDNHKEIQFVEKPGESNFHRAVLNQSVPTVDIASVSEDLQQVLSSDFLLNDILGLSSIAKTQQRYFEYVLGFDNIRPKFHTFSERSVFVSNKITINQPGQFGLQVVEKRPFQLQSSTDITTAVYQYAQQSAAEDEKFYHGVVEYWLFMQAFSQEDFLVGTNVIPVLPLGAERVYHEQLVLTHKSASTLLNANIGSLMHYTDADSTDVKVYRNGTVLTYGTTASADWEFVGPGQNIDNAELTLTSANAGSRMKRGIRLWNTAINPLDIYTVSYTPKVSNTRSDPSDSSLFTVVDLIGDRSMRIVADNVITFDRQRGSHIIGSIEAYLIVIMRRNSANDNFSPILEEYTMSWSSRDDQRFAGV